jgi:hypothetical protein
MATFAALAAAVVNGQFTQAIQDTIKNNFDFFRTPPKAYYAPSTGAANITTTSTSMVDLTGFTVTFTTQGGQVLVMFLARANGTTVRFDIDVDGVSVTGDSDGVGAPGATGEVAVLRLLALTATSHTIKIRWRVTSGTGTIYPAGLCQLVAWEVFLP